MKPKFQLILTASVGLAKLLATDSNVLLPVIQSIRQEKSEGKSISESIVDIVEEGKMLMKCYDRQQRSSPNKLPVFRSILIQRQFVQGNWFPESGTGLSPSQKWET